MTHLGVPFNLIKLQCFLVKVESGWREECNWRKEKRCQHTLWDKGDSIFGSLPSWHHSPAILSWWVSCTSSFILVTSLSGFILKQQHPKSVLLTEVSIDRWMDKEDVVHIHTMEYYSVIKRNKMLSFAATWMDLEIIIQNQVNQRNTDIILYCLHVESKKMIQMNLQTEINLQT